MCECVWAHRSSMELSDVPRSRAPDEAPAGPVKSGSSYSTAQQQRYSASVFLQRKEMLEQVRSPATHRPPPAGHACTHPTFFSFFFFALLLPQSVWGSPGRVSPPCELWRRICFISFKKTDYSLCIAAEPLQQGITAARNEN